MNITAILFWDVVLDWDYNITMTPWFNLDCSTDDKFITSRVQTSLKMYNDEHRYKCHQNGNFVKVRLPTEFYILINGVDHSEYDCNSDEYKTGEQIKNSSYEFIQTYIDDVNEKIRQEREEQNKRNATKIAEQEIKQLLELQKKYPSVR